MNTVKARFLFFAACNRSSSKISDEVLFSELDLVFMNSLFKYLVISLPARVSNYTFGLSRFPALRIATTSYNSSL